jgi:RNA polymerase sigma-70 factor (ECF subfamily)
VTLSATDRASQTASDPDLFELEAIPYMRQMFPAALRLTRNRCDAEDLIQETFTRAYQKFHLFSPGTNLRAWLHRIMFHVFYSNYRKRRRRPAETLAGDVYDSLDPQLVPAGGSAESQALEQLASSPVMRALRDLPEVFKTVVFLADVQGYQYAEIADIMGTPIGTVMSRIHRGRRMLRTRLVEGGAVPAARRPARTDEARSRQHVLPRRELPAPGAVTAAAGAAGAGAAPEADAPLAA